MSDPRVLGIAWLPLDRAALCLDDEQVFDLAEGQCPRCGSASFVLLAKWLVERSAVSV